MKTATVCLLILFVAAGSISQEGGEFLYNPPELESMLENTSDDDADQAMILDQLEFYQLNPVNVNTASYLELAELPFLSPQSARRIIDLRDSLGSLSKDGMSVIPELNRKSLSLVSQLLSYGREETEASVVPETPGSYKALFRSRGGMDLQLRKSTRDKDYL